MSARVELAKVIYTEGAFCGDCEYDGWDTCATCRRTCIGYAAAALAAGFSKPCTIKTFEELDALPVGTVVLDPIGLSLHKDILGNWNVSNGVRGATREELERDAFPATVLYEPAP